MTFGNLRTIGATTIGPFMDTYFEDLIIRAATIDELLSHDFEPLPGQKSDADLAARRLAAWCKACASGDWSLFCKRLARDGLSIADVLARFASVRRSSSARIPEWIEDAIWIETALRNPTKGSVAAPDRAEPCAFEHLFTPLLEEAEARLRSGIHGSAFDKLNEAAHACLRYALLQMLSSLSAPALYERFVTFRKNSKISADPTDKLQRTGSSIYNSFIAEMKTGGLRGLFEDKPVLLRLIATVTRQWIEASHEFVLRLDADLSTMRRDILQSSTHVRVAKIEGGLSDPHNGGRSVQIVSFEDGSRVVYKPKDLRPDVAWYALIEQLNLAAAPVELRAARAMAQNGYGWTEFIDHAGCADPSDCTRFFGRAGAWLALFHCFTGGDMHGENIIATGDHPVPIDLEMILQSMSKEHKSHDAEAQAFDAAMDTISNSVMMVGLLPMYIRPPNNDVSEIGGMISDSTMRAKLIWKDINTDNMRPVKTKEAGEAVPNLPHVGGRYAMLGDHIEDFILGFQDYAKFLMRLGVEHGPQGSLLETFAGLPVRKIIRPTRFYYMLLQRLKDHRTMDDGVIWSAQADFVTRLTDWEEELDSFLPLRRAERSALLQLNVPHFISCSDDDRISDATGISIRTGAISGLDRAQARMQSLDEGEIVRQVVIIRLSTSSVLRSRRPATHRKLRERLPAAEGAVPTPQFFVAEADKIAEDLASYAIRRGPGASWVALDWLGDSEFAQLVTLGPDLYNGHSGIAIFLAAHAAVTGRKSSEELALAAIAHLRKNLRSNNAARMARSLGIGGAYGLGSIVYSLALIAKSLGCEDLLVDTHAAAGLFTDDLIAADRQLDIMGGCAGAILALLRLFRDGQSSDVLKYATKCGEHLLAQPRQGPVGCRSWIGIGMGERLLNGMSHGAAGYAYALASLAAATGREEFAEAASECIAFENSTYDPSRNNWPDLRSGEGPLWPCQWCHGATGIGLARIATSKSSVWGLNSDSEMRKNVLEADVRNAILGAERGWPHPIDTMCCGTLGTIEFFCAASDALRRSDLREVASRRLMAVVESASSTGDYRLYAGGRQFNIGLFGGVAGVGYCCLRQVAPSLPNGLMWE
jgi:type 2 lantibiotic biosynthesis protein LanM